MTDTEIVAIREAAAIDDCFEAFHALRPHLDRDALKAQILRQFAQGYRVLALRRGDQIESVAGYRHSEFLAWGRIIYIDDLSTVPGARQRGQARQLLDAIVAEARAAGCVAVHLDSGYARQAAHRLYLRYGFVLSSHHFALSLSD
jgi:GNAT superfamily N-acetyltransferase